jgi:hypothetical protein
MRVSRRRNGGKLHLQKLQRAHLNDARANPLPLPLPLPVYQLKII